jgi:hypothetical protein
MVVAFVVIYYYSHQKGEMLVKVSAAQAPQQSSFIKPIRLDENQYFVDHC